MNRSAHCSILAALLAATGLVAPRTAQGQGTDAILRVVPDSFPLTVVILNLEKLDGEIQKIAKRFDPEGADDSMLDQFRTQLDLAKWVDFSKPVAIAYPSFNTDSEAVLWANIPDFVAKAKGVEGTTEEDGLWRIPFDAETEVFARVMGDYVMASPVRDLLERAGKKGATLAAVKTRGSVLGGRDLLIHVNFEPVRPMALGGIAQAAMMAPMIAGMAAGQAGMDPAAMTGVINAVLDAAKKFVEQVAYLDVSIGFTEKAADVTVTTGYVEGPIQSYLARQKPAAIQFLDNMEEQPFAVASGFHLPGRESPVSAFFIDRISSAMMTGPAADGASGEEPGALTKKAVDTMRELYRQLEGMSMVMAMSADGMKLTGDYIGHDAPALLSLVKRSITDLGPMVKKLKGATYEPMGVKAIGGANVELFSVKVDAGSPSAAFLESLYGDDPQFGMGVIGDRLRFCMGSDEIMAQAFAGRVSKPLSKAKYVSEALAALPDRRNGVVLIDLAGLIPMLGPSLGMPDIGPIPAGPPLAISVSLAGDVARLDMHIPFRAIDRVIQAMAPDEPM